MSKLDKIRVEFGEFTVPLDPNAKQQIKELMRELIGENEPAKIGGIYQDTRKIAGRNEIRYEIWQKVNEL